MFWVVFFFLYVKLYSDAVLIKEPLLYQSFKLNPANWEQRVNK